MSDESQIPVYAAHPADANDSARLRRLGVGCCLGGMLMVLAGLICSWAAPVHLADPRQAAKVAAIWYGSAAAGLGLLLAGLYCLRRLQ